MPSNTGKRRRALKQGESVTEEDPSTRLNNGFGVTHTPPKKRVRLNDDKENDAMASTVTDMEVDADAASEPAKVSYTSIHLFGVRFHLNTRFVHRVI